MTQKAVQGPLQAKNCPLFIWDELRTGIQEHKAENEKITTSSLKWSHKNIIKILFLVFVSQ